MYKNINILYVMPLVLFAATLHLTPSRFTPSLITEVLMKLFIDDVRLPSQVGFNNEEWVIARNYDEAIKIIEEHKPQRIAFDHDLAECHYQGTQGNEKTGYDIALYLIEKDNETGDYITAVFNYTVHSMNPDGARRIRQALHSHMRRKLFQ
jgi:hypothetical protein